MGTNISWCDDTWNPTVGCERVSPGCAHCYAKTLHDMRHKAIQAGKHLAPQYALPFETVQLMPERLERPLHWRKPRKIFVNSVSDLFHESVPDWFIDQVFSVMWRAHWHTFQILTKRPERMQAYMKGRWCLANPVLPNVWLGVSVENQHFAESRIPILMNTPAAVRFLSCEPLLGPLNLRRFLQMHSIRCQATGGGTGMPVAPVNLTTGCTCPRIDWLITGGESGKGYRPMDLDWARDLREQCVDAAVAFWFKQGNAYRSEQDGHLDGVVWHQFPGDAAPAVHMDSVGAGVSA